MRSLRPAWAVDRRESDARPLGAGARRASLRRVLASMAKRANARDEPLRPAALDPGRQAGSVSPYGRISEDDAAARLAAVPRDRETFQCVISDIPDDSR